MENKTAKTEMANIYPESRVMSIFSERSSSIDIAITFKIFVPNN